MEELGAAASGSVGDNSGSGDPKGGGKLELGAAGANGSVGSGANGGAGGSGVSSI